MTPENFCYWLQGFFEISGTTELTKEQVVMIEEHLQLIFNKQTKKSVKDLVVAPEDLKPMPFVKHPHETRYC